MSSPVETGGGVKISYRDCPWNYDWSDENLKLTLYNLASEGSLGNALRMPQWIRRISQIIGAALERYQVG